MRLGKVGIRGYALGSEERLSEAQPSSSLLTPGFSVSPDPVVFPASWSGADASHLSALNTSSAHLRSTVFVRIAQNMAPPQIQISHS